MKRNKIVTLLTLVTALVTAFQGVIPALPITNTSTITLISASAVFAALLLTVWKQYLSKEIANDALMPTLFVAIIASMGGLNEWLNALHFSEAVSQWLRFGITFATLALNMVSKVLWPTAETKSLL